MPSERLDCADDAADRSSRLLWHDARVPPSPNDSSEFEYFYRRSYPAAKRLAYLLLNGSADAEDVTQDSFWRLHDRFQDLATPDAYLRTTIVNACRQHHRSNERRTRWLRLATAGDDAWIELADPMLDAVAVLPFRQRAAIVLRYWVDLPDDDIATTLDVKPATVRSLVQRGLQRLRKEIQP